MGSFFTKEERPLKWAEKMIMERQEKEKNSSVNTNENEDIIKDTDTSNDTVIEQIQAIDINNLVSFSSQPFRAYTEEKKKELIDSIAVNGMINPVIVRPIDNKTYQIISGHNRVNACRELEYKNVPCIVKNIDDDVAMLEMIESNLICREELLPSEKAFAYKIKMDTMKHQGKNITCGQIVHKTRDIISDEESGRQVQRYIRLTELIPEFLDMVDEKTLPFTVGVSLSYLSKSEQYEVLKYIEEKNIKINMDMANKILELSKEQEILFDLLTDIFEKKEDNRNISSKPKKISISLKKIKAIPEKITEKELNEIIVRLLEKYFNEKVDQEMEL